MREILFRGKHVDNGEWIEGYYYFEPYTERAYIVRWNSFGMGFNEFIRVDPATVGQYTGVRDKNGVRIFEGDLVEPYDDEFDKAVIEFHNGRFCICYYGIPGMQMEYGWDETAGDYGLCDCEELQYDENEVVIGNIHDKD